MLHLLFGFVLIASPPGGEPSLSWQSDYAAAVKDAQQADRPVLIVLAPASSPFGQKAASGELFEAGKARELAANYARLLVDTDTPKGKTTAEQFGATELPRVVVLDRSGKWQVYYRSGEHTPDEIATVLDQHREDKYSTVFARDGSRMAWPVAGPQAVLCRT